MKSSRKISAQSIAVRIGVVSVALIVASSIAIDAIHLPGIDALALTLAWLAAHAVALLGVPAYSSGAVIDANGFAAVIVQQCTAIEVIVVFGTGVIVLPVSLRARLWALALGVPALCVLNLARVVSLLLIGANLPEYLDLAHLAIWQTAMAFVGLALWLLWAQWASDGEGK